MPDESTDSEFDISFFVPCLNEELNIIQTFETIVSVSEKLELSYEILIFDDKSTDKTVEKVNAYIGENPGAPIKLHKNSATKGLGYNYTEGAFQGVGKYYLLVNGDNADSREWLELTLAHLGEADIIIPNFYQCDYRPWHRRWISTVFTKWVNLLNGYSIKYYNGQVIHLRYNVMRWHSDTQGYAYQAELLTKLLYQGASFAEVTVPNDDRQAGVSKAFRLLNIISVAYSLFEIFLRRIRRDVYH